MLLQAALMQELLKQATLDAACGCAQNVILVLLKILPVLTSGMPLKGLTCPSRVKLMSNLAYKRTLNPRERGMLDSVFSGSARWQLRQQ